MLGVDISNWTGLLARASSIPFSAPRVPGGRAVCSRVDSALVSAWKAAGVRRVVIACQFPQYFTEQARVCLDSGFDIAAYRYVYFDESPGAQAEQAMEVVAGWPVQFVAGDFEDDRPDVLPPTPGGVEGVCHEFLDRIPAKLRWCYTGQWWLNKYLLGSASSTMRACPLWAAQWSGAPGAPFQPFGGWTEAAGIQYQGGGNVSPPVSYDFDVFTDQAGPEPPAVGPGGHSVEDVYQLLAQVAGRFGIDSGAAPSRTPVLDRLVYA